MNLRLIAGVLLAFVLCAAPVCLGAARSAAQAPTNLLDQLLDVPSPAPDWHEQQGTNHPNIAVVDTAPGKDLPVDEFLALWGDRLTRAKYEAISADGAASNAYMLFTNQIPAAVREQLLNGCEQGPKHLPWLLNALPQENGAYDRVHAIFQDPKNAKLYDKRARERVKNWLMEHSTYFRADLIDAAKQLSYTGAWLENTEAVETLARIDWPAAQPILEKHARCTNAHVAAFALSIIYEHALASNATNAAAQLREKLKKFVQNKKTPGTARAQACCALLAHDWQGRNEWFVQLLSSDSVSEGWGDYHYGGNALPAQAFVTAHADIWIPRLTAWVGSTNRVFHNNAVACLIQFVLERARGDALRPLVPWLSDTNWSSAPDRLRLIQSLDRVIIPESVPGLLWVAEHENDYVLVNAAEALAHHGATNAVPLLKQAIPRTKEETHQRDIIKAIQTLGGFSNREIADAVVAFAVRMSTPEGADAVEDAVYAVIAKTNLDPQVSVGRIMSEPEQPCDAVATDLFARADRLQATDAASAAKLRELVEAWPCKASCLEVLDRITNGTATARTICSALDHRAALTNFLGNELRDVRAYAGTAKGIIAVVLADTVLLEEILDGHDAKAQVAALACARLVRQPLPVDKVAALLDQPAGQLARAAERYLACEDSAAARQAILSHSHGTLPILGARPASDPGHFTFSEFDQQEERLRDDMRGQDAPDEIYALFSAGYWGGDNQRIVLVKNGTGTLRICYGNGKYAERSLGKNELDEFLAMIRKHNADNLAPLNITMFDGMQYEYVHLTSNGGRRVFMNNPDSAPEKGAVYPLLTRLFYKLAEAAPLTVHYDIEKRVKGMAIIFADQHNPVDCVWKAGNDTRVLVIDEQNETSSWYAVVNGKLAGKVGQPDACPILGCRFGMPPDQNYLNVWPWQATVDGCVIRCGSYRAGDDGVWKCRRAGAPRRLLKGKYALPIVTPDGRWLVLAKTEGNWAVPNIVVRYDLVNRKEIPLDIPAADNFNPVAFVRPHNRVLLYRQRDGSKHRDEKSAGPEQTEYRLLDPATGTSTIVQGVFWPWHQQTYRPLQSAGTNDLVWAARYVGADKATVVGLYDTRAFTFTRLMTIPEVRFNSMDMWVDQQEKQVYVAINGDLLRLPLPAGQEHAP